MNIRFVVLIILCCLLGFGYYTIEHQWILFRFPTRLPPTTLQLSHHKKKIILYSWHHDAWQKETKEIVWPEQLAQALQNLITTWLIFIQEEQPDIKKISLQSIALGPNLQDLYISFDRNPFFKQSPTFEKLMWIESLLKTLANNAIPVSNVFFLVNHQPLYDTHLDFSQSWPLKGFTAL